jgi:hypothetical protein
MNASACFAAILPQALPEFNLIPEISRRVSTLRSSRIHGELRNIPPQRGVF